MKINELQLYRPSQLNLTKVLNEIFLYFYTFKNGYLHSYTFKSQYQGCIPRHKVIKPGKEMNTINTMIIVTFWASGGCIWKRVLGVLLGVGNILLLTPGQWVLWCLLYNDSQRYICDYAYSVCVLSIFTLNSFRSLS